MAENEKIEKDAILEEMSVEHKNRFSLIELVMIIMLVGVIITIVIPIRSTMKNEVFVKASIKDMITIIQAEEAFKSDPALGDGDYAVDKSQLKLPTFNEEYFTYAVTDTSVNAVSTSKFSKREVTFYYLFKDKAFKVDPKFKDYIEPSWLP